VNATSGQLLPHSLAAISELSALPAVAMQIDGQNLIAAFEPDRHEHVRRSRAGAGAVTSRSLLHGLWLLPSGIPVPAAALPTIKQQRLRKAHPFAVEGESGFERRYSPPGVVRAVAFAGRDPRALITRAIRFTPIVERMVVTPGDRATSSNDRQLAEEFGIGIVTISDHGAQVVLGQQAAALGVPAVFRWWIAELAYEGWLQQSAHPVS
jgi:hypothetical protein